MGKFEIGILGGGLAGLSLAYFIKENSLAIIEKNKTFGGLTRSFRKNGIDYDIGPHIIFSKNKDILDFMNSISENKMHKRLNQIFHRGNFIKYPFENHIAQLEDQEEINYCLNTFLNNPYEKMVVTNMLVFFLKTFGEGITKTFLQPYNEKIWKFDPSMMDTRMVERIPKPPKNDIINSARGKFSEGYLHQYYFFYPKKNAIQSLANGFIKDLAKRKINLRPGESVISIKKEKALWEVKTRVNKYYFKKIVNCMPLHEFFNAFTSAPDDVKESLQDLKYNSIFIILINVKRDNLKNSFATMFHQKNVIFHRLSKLDFMGDSYHIKNSSSLLLEVTFREGDRISKMSKDDLIDRCIDDMIKIGVVSDKRSINFTDFRKEKYAYVIYDLNHRKNIEHILAYLNKIGVSCVGRFAEFEYLNMDQIFERTMALAKKLNLEFIL